MLFSSTWRQINFDEDALPYRVPRVLLIASAGGHWIELGRIAPAFADYHCLFVSTSPGLNSPLDGAAVPSVSDGSRDTWPQLVITARDIWPIVRRFRPDYLVSTGAAPGAIALFIGKLHGAKTIWLDSIANSEELSLSGKAVAHIADLTLTQWKHLAGGKIQYAGQVL